MMSDVINLGETILPSMNIEEINGEWFYDDVTPRGVSFDGFLPQACKIPLGNMQDFELIHTPEKMAEFQSNEWYRKNWRLADTLMTFSPLRSEKSVLIEAYRKGMEKILSSPCDSENCQHDAFSDAWPTRGSCRGLRVLHEDLSRYGDMMTGNNDFDEGKFYDVKKEIYRLTDRVIAALAKFCEVKSTGIFAILDELYEKKVISSEARDNLGSASAIAIRLRLSTYLEAGKQGEKLSSNSNDKTHVYHMPTDEELFHFFFVTIPLYDELRQFKTSGNIPSSLAIHSFFDDSDITMGHIYGRLLKYDKAIQCYERAIRENQENLTAEIHRIRVSLFATHDTEESDKIRGYLDNLLGKIVKNFSQLDTDINEATVEFTPLYNRLDMEKCRQLFEGLHCAYQFYGSRKYSVIAEAILSQILPTPDECKPNEFVMLVLAFCKYFDEVLRQKDDIDWIVCKLTSLIDDEGVSTSSIVLLNNLGEFLLRRGKLEKAYRCFQRALSMEHLLYGTRPNVNMITSLRCLGNIAKRWYLLTESTFYFKSLVQLFESFDGINTKLCIKEAYMELSSLSCMMGNAADETLRNIETGLKITTGSKNEKELYLNCLLYCKLAIIFHFQKSSKEACKATLNAQACLRNSACTEMRQNMIWTVGETLLVIKKTKEGIELLEEHLEPFTLESQVQEKALYLKGLGKFCLRHGLALEAEKYYSQAINVQTKNNEDVFHDLECRIGISKAVVMKDSVPKEKQVLDEALLNSAIKLPASNKKCSFLQEIGKLCQSIGEIDDARRCYVEAFRSAKELPANDKKCSFLKTMGELCEGIFEFALARQWYDMALKTYKEETNISKNAVSVEFYLEMKLGMFAKKTAQRIHYDRAAVILRQHVATGHVNSTTARMFQILASGYSSIDPNEKIGLLLEAVKVSEIVYGENKSDEMVACLLQELSHTYNSLGDKQNSMKYRNRQIKMELELNSSNPFREHILKTFKKWALASFHDPSDDSIERVGEFYLSSLKDKAFSLNTAAAKTVAAKCFTFIAVLFYNAGDPKKAESSNEKASQLFGEVEESVETEREPCRELCDLLKTILSSRTILPSHRRELYISVVNLSGPHPFNVSAEEERFMQDHGHNGNEEPIKEVQKQARSTLVEDRKTLSPQLIIQSQSEVLEYHKKKGDFRRAAEIHASLQPQQLNFIENSPFDGVEKFICDAIEAKEENRPGHAIRLLDLALQVQLHETRWRRTQKIFKLRGECFLSMGHFRSAVIDFTKADALYSIQGVDHREVLCEYSEVLIGLIKSEILCNNVEAAWLVCEKGIKLASDHELEENINQQFVYLGAKCLNISSERGEDKEGKLDRALALCLQAQYSFCKHAEIAGIGSSISLEEVRSYMEMTLLSLDISKKRKLQEENETERRFKQIKIIFPNIPPDSMNKGKSKFVEMSVAIARVFLIKNDIEQSIFLVNKSLVALFSSALPDVLSFYEEVLPLLQVITATKSSAPEQSRSPFQQALDMCKKTLTNQKKTSNYVNQFFTNLIIIYRSLGQAEEAVVVAEIGLEVIDLMCHRNDSDKINNRCRMLLHLAQIHQQNSSNPAFNANEELSRAEQYYLTDRGRQEDIVLYKDLSYANFLCERKRFSEAVAVLDDMKNLGKQLWNMYVDVDYFSSAFYGAGVEKSVIIDGELLTTVGDILYNLMVRAYVGMGKKKEAVATCEIFTGVNWLDVHESAFGKRPSCKPYLVEDCHREEERNQFQNCDFPLSSGNLATLYYRLGEYDMAVKYFPEEVESSEMLEMKISCLHLAGNELVDSNKGDESIFFFKQFLAMLQVKEGFLDKPFHNQCEFLQAYSFANQYYLFRTLGGTHAERENVDAAIQCYERCIELDEDFTCGQEIVATLSELYQTKALTADLKNEDPRAVYMDLAWKLFQQLFQKTAELTTFVELSYASLLSRLGRYEEAVKHFKKVAERADYTTSIRFRNVDKPLVDVYLRREIESLDGGVVIPIKVLALYELILTFIKLNQIRNAQNVAIFLDGVVKRYRPTLLVNDLITHSMAGYAYMLIGNKEKAAEIFVSVLEMNPGHPPVTKTLESCCI